MGESYGNFKVGQDALIFPYINSCNIACGFHGGDPLTIENTIVNAIKYDLRIGAHPSYPDLAGFGRREMKIPRKELFSIIKYQVAALKGMVKSKGGKLSYVKPHGALYNKMATDLEEAKTVIYAIKEIDPRLSLMGLANTFLANISKELHIEFIPEAFADRRYNSDGTLVSRGLEGAVIEEPEAVLKQVKSIFNKGKTKSIEGDWININAETICIHGDNPFALDILMMLKKAFS